MTAKHKAAPAAKTPKANEAFPEPTKAEIQEARAQGVKDAISESTKDAYMTGANEGYGDGETEGKPAVQGTKDVFHLQDLVDLPPDALQDVLDGKGTTGRAPVQITDAQVAGLIEVERSGKNRTDIVQLLCKHLGIKHPGEVTAAGPAYTNDVTRL